MVLTSVETFKSSRGEMYTRWEKLCFSSNQFR